MAQPTQPTMPRHQGWILPIATIVLTGVAIAAAFLGSGALGGTPINEAAGGALSADATPISPAGPAFRIWSVIYLGLIAYAVRQLFGVARRSERQAALRPWALASIVLNSVWIWMVQLGSLVASVIVIVVLLAVLIRIMFLLGRPRTGGWIEWLVSDASFGLYFGWVLVAVFANVWAWMADAGVGVFLEIPLGMVGVIVVAAVALSAAALNGGRVAPALATAWGLAWIAVGRTDGQHESGVLVSVAALAAVVVLLSPVLGFLRRRTTQRFERATT